MRCGCCRCAGWRRPWRRRIREWTECKVVGCGFFHHLMSESYMRDKQIMTVNVLWMPEQLLIVLEGFFFILLLAFLNHLTKYSVKIVVPCKPFSRVGLLLNLNPVFCKRCFYLVADVVHRYSQPSFFSWGSKAIVNVHLLWWYSINNCFCGCYPRWFGRGME